MEEKIKAFVLHSPGDMRLEEIPMPQLSPDDALVKIKSVGVCGSDVHYYRNGRIGSFIVEDPLILGHECSGEVVSVGPEVKNVKPGDRVVMEPGIPCRKCWYCKNGRYNKCPDIEFMATPPFHGSMVEYMAWPSDFLFKMPDSMSFQEGALVEPLAVGLFATRRSGLYPSASVTILGAGPIGLSVLEAVKVMGAGRVISIDVVPKRLELAKQMGATHMINAKETNAVEAVKELTNGEGTHFVFETAGTDKTIQQTAEIARDGGTVVLLGLPPQLEIEMPIVECVIREVNFMTSFRYCNIFEEAVTLIAHGKVNVKPLLTHEFAFKDTLEAFDVSEHQKDSAVKVMINI
ncbi:MAG: NAD(P)-dependent alcohol dehydrogenase [Desulfobacteraceae bacterium]|nr:NAD(P)-dependent alcohol dehydrogenase [Desulfobacteraceae bacterium]